MRCPLILHSLFLILNLNTTICIRTSVGHWERIRAIDDSELNALSVAIVPLAGGEFYHFGTSREMISSTMKLQNVVSDQRLIMHNDRKPHPSIFVQNAMMDMTFSAENTNIWIENSYVKAVGN